MKKNPYLQTAAKRFKKQSLYPVFRDENVLELSLDKKSHPFAFLTVERDQFPGIIMSLAYDFSDAYLTADITLFLMHVCPVALGEAFYRSKDATLYWGEDASFRYALENDDKLIKELPVYNDNLH